MCIRVCMYVCYTEKRVRLLKNNLLVQSNFVERIYIYVSKIVIYKDIYWQ